MLDLNWRTHQYIPLKKKSGKDNLLCRAGWCCIIIRWQILICITLLRFRFIWTLTAISWTCIEYPLDLLFQLFMTTIWLCMVMIPPPKYQTNINLHKMEACKDKQSTIIQVKKSTATKKFQILINKARQVARLKTDLPAAKYWTWQLQMWLVPFELIKLNNFIILWIFFKIFRMSDSF